MPSNVKLSLSSSPPPAPGDYVSGVMLWKVKRQNKITTQTVSIVHYFRFLYTAYISCNAPSRVCQFALQQSPTPQHQTPNRIQPLRIPDLGDQLARCISVSSKGKDYSSCHHDSGTEGDATSIAVVVVDQCSSDGCASKACEAHDKG